MVVVAVVVVGVVGIAGIGIIGGDACIFIRPVFDYINLFAVKVVAVVVVVVVVVVVDNNTVNTSCFCSTEDLECCFYVIFFKIFLYYKISNIMISFFRSNFLREYYEHYRYFSLTL